MDAEDFLEAVRTEQQTELSRLGSSKSLYADTEGDVEKDAVLAAVADAFSHAAETFEAWADEEDGEAGELFAAAAETVGEQYGTVAGELGDHQPGAPPAVVEYLRGLDTTVERVAGYVGWAMVTENKVGQAVGFFVGQAAPGTADTFRDLRGEIESAVDDGTDVLVAICNGDRANLAETTAVETIQAAYEEYFDTLEAMGVNPKPVC